jgi:hypothetical protein
MSFSWLITGISRERPRLGDLGEYDGEDVYHPNQPTRGQIDEALMLFTGKPILVVAVDPSGCCSHEELAQEVKETILEAFSRRSEDDPVTKVINDSIGVRQTGMALLSYLRNGKNGGSRCQR